jgi:hypothetical protein
MASFKKLQNTRQTAFATTMLLCCWQQLFYWNPFETKKKLCDLSCVMVSNFTRSSSSILLTIALLLALTPTYLQSVKHFFAQFEPL